MNENLFNILDYINEGIVILNDKLDILFWNKGMEGLVGIKKDAACNSKLFEVLPQLNKNYFKKAIDGVLGKGYKYFFSSKMHQSIISDDFEINLKLNKIEREGSIYLMIEFIDITSQCIRIDQLKEYANELYFLNTELKNREKEIERLAYYDKLTNVGNRTLFYTLAEKLLASAKRNNTILGLMFIDIDRFKSINDKYGHIAGDKVLVKMANTLTKSVRETDTVVRHGGDEFLILLPDLKEYYNYKLIANRILCADKKVKVTEDVEIDISLSMGISFYPKDGDTIDQLILKADEAMYNVKRMGGDKCIKYN